MGERKDEEGNETGSTHTETVTYSVDISVGEGIKEFRLAKGLKGHWEQISSTTEMTAERYVYEADTEISAEDGGYGYSYFSYFTMRLYSYSDAEYINDICKIWNCGGGKYLWYTNKVATGHKIGKVMQQVWREGAVAYDAVGIAGSIMNLQKGRLPASFLIPTDDPQYNKDGSNALGAYGYMLNSRTWAYDVGLAMTVWCIRCCLQYTRQLKVLAKAQQAQMRSQLLEQYHFYMDDGWISEEHMEDWENQYQAYHSLGENGILDSRRAELLKLPNRKSNKEEQDNE